MYEIVMRNEKLSYLGLNNITKTWVYSLIIVHSVFMQFHDNIMPNYI